MQNIKFMWNNIWKLGTVTASSQESYLLAGNTQNRTVAKPWRSNYSGAGGRFEITTSNQKLYFNEGAGDLTATLTVGIYTQYALMTEIKTQMETAGANTYTITRAAYKFVIGSDSAMILKGTTTTNAIWSTIGFDESDTSSLNSHTADEIRIHTEEYITCNIATAQSFSSVFLMGCNISTTGIVTMEGSADDFATVGFSIGLDKSGINYAKIATSSSSFKDVRIKVVDIDNPLGYIQIGVVGIGDMFEPEWGFNPKYSDDLRDPSYINESEGKQINTILLEKYWGRRYKFDCIDFSLWSDFWESIGLAKAFILLEKTSVLLGYADPEENFKYVRFKSFKPKHLSGDKDTLSVSVVEEL